MKTAIEKLREEINQKQELIDYMAGCLDRGRDYLMQVSSDKITVEDALESFGFGRNGLLQQPLGLKI